MDGSIAFATIIMIFLALFFTFCIPCIIAVLIYYLEHVHKPLELAKMGKYDEYIESKKTIKEKVIFREVVMIPCQ